MKTYTVRSIPISVWNPEESDIPAGSLQIYRSIDPERSVLVCYVERLAGEQGGAMDGRRMADAVLRHLGTGHRFVRWHGLAGTTHGIVEQLTKEDDRETVRKLMTENGYDVEATGGGCEAWRRDMDNEGRSYILICTEDQGIEGEPDEANWLVGHHDEECGFVEMDGTFTLARALEIAAVLPAPSPLGNQTTLTVEQLAETIRENRFNALCVEYEAWNKAQGLSLGSADEHLNDESLTAEQQQWVRDFAARWEKIDNEDEQVAAWAAAERAEPTGKPVNAPLTAADALAGAITYLELAHDVHEGDPDTAREVQAIMDALQAMLAQKGCEHFDPAVTDGHLTTLIDVIING